MKKKILITGANGFFGKNFFKYFNELGEYEISTFTRDQSDTTLLNLLKENDIIFHFAGKNRPINKEEFFTHNHLLTKKICDYLTANKLKKKIIFPSSIHVFKNNDYGKSKILAENELKRYKSKVSGSKVFIFRLPHIAGKWCKPNYNSIIATMCYKVIRNQKIKIFNQSQILKIIFIDDFINACLKLIKNDKKNDVYRNIDNIYKISVANLHKRIISFKKFSENLTTPNCCEKSFDKLLYSVFLTYLPFNKMFYKIPKYKDKRGQFSEFIKTDRSGQISFFTSEPGVTRGLHYHNIKVEKFLIIKGKCEFSVCNIIDKKVSKKIITDQENIVIKTVPGFAHKIKNIGSEKLVAIVWANEIFDRNKPDTYGYSF